MENKNFRQLVEESLISDKQLDEGFVKNLALAGAIAGSVASALPVADTTKMFSPEHILSHIPHGDSMLVKKDTGYNAAPYIKTHHKEMIEKFGNTHPQVLTDLAHNKAADEGTLDAIANHPNSSSTALYKVAKRTKYAGTLETLMRHNNLDNDTMRAIARNGESEALLPELKKRGVKDADDIHASGIENRRNERQRKRDEPMEHDWVS